MTQITPEYLRDIADNVREEQAVNFLFVVNQCVNDVIDDLERHLILLARNGQYSAQSSINICDPEYTEKLKEFDLAEFESVVHERLREYWLERGFFVPLHQSNYFEISWEKQ